MGAATTLTRCGSPHSSEESLYDEEMEAGSEHEEGEEEEEECLSTSESSSEQKVMPHSPDSRTHSPTSAVRPPNPVNGHVTNRKASLTLGR